MLSLIRTVIYPQFAEFLFYLDTSYQKIVNTFRAINLKLPKQVKKAQSEKSKGKNSQLDKKIYSIAKDLQTQQQEIERISATSLEIIKQLEITPNVLKFEPEDLILYATSFSSNDVTLTETQSECKGFHKIIIKNNTTFYWENIFLYIPCTDEILI